LSWTARGGWVMRFLMRLPRARARHASWKSVFLCSFICWFVGLPSKLSRCVVDLPSRAGGSESLDTTPRCSLRISSSPSKSVHMSTKDGHSRRHLLASHQTVRSITLFIIQSPQSRSAVPKLTASEVPSPILKMAATNQRQRPLRSTAWL